ncbi:hypothetical protein SAMN05428976_10883 [Clostridium sp. USBA 49]|jgi:hypothetical protein|uniref:hypothetical protein n=1 Tax=Clostridium TaxID=1485 RepID=UPI0009CDA917|nr:MULTISPECIES: hypothetical protein [Clostridium]SKA86456.1 hypothetical protein SAMN05428976_10883 [Clostridium sp. USBA 49]
MSEFNEDCPFREQMEGVSMMPGYIPMPISAQQMYPQYQGIPGFIPGMPYFMTDGTTAVPPYPTPQTLQGIADSNFETAPGSPVQQDINYTQGYLRTQIGKRVLISFLIGTNTYQDRTGVLEKVGISYVILREPEGTELLCDIYSIKFVRVFSETK